MAGLNEKLAAADAAGQPPADRRPHRDRRAGRRPGTPLLNPLPGTAFEASTPLSCRVDTKARICVRQSYYSVPARLAGRRVDVALGADWIAVRARRDPRARHTRSPAQRHRGPATGSLPGDADTAPGAFAGATALVAARAEGAFTQTHQRFWDTARRQVGDRDGTRALIGVLLLHRTLPADAVLAGIDAALSAGQM